MIEGSLIVGRGVRVDVRCGRREICCVHEKNITLSKTESGPKSTTVSALDLGKRANESIAVGLKGKRKWRGIGTWYRIAVRQ